MGDIHEPLVHGQRGFTLIEVLIAMAIVTTGALSLAHLTATVAALVTRSRHQSEAMWLADGGIATVQGEGGAGAPDACLLQDVDGCVAFVDASGQRTADPRAPYSVRWSVTRFTSTPMTAVITVCGVPARERAPAAFPPGTCVARLAMAGVP